MESKHKEHKKKKKRKKQAHAISSTRDVNTADEVKKSYGSAQSDAKSVARAAASTSATFVKKNSTSSHSGVRESGDADTAKGKRKKKTRKKEKETEGGIAVITASAASGRESLVEEKSAHSHERLHVHDGDNSSHDAVHKKEKKHKKAKKRTRTETVQSDTEVSPALHENSGNENSHRHEGNHDRSSKKKNKNTDTEEVQESKTQAVATSDNLASTDKTRAEKKKRKRHENEEVDVNEKASGNEDAMHELDEQVPQKKRKRKSDKQIPGAKQSASGFFAHKWDEEKEAGPKQFKIGTWTMDEDAMLLRLFHEFSETEYDLKTENEKLKVITEPTRGTRLNGFWLKFSQHFQFRTVRSVFRRAYRLLHPGNYGGEWTKEDFEALKHYVELYGRKWNKIGTLMERLPNSCRNQYLRVLQRDFTYGAWTIAEEQRLTELVKKYSTRLGESQYVGISWKAVEAEMGTRSACQCIKKWYSGFGARALGRPWTASEDLALVQAVQEDGATEWSEVAWNDLEGTLQPGAMCKTRLRNMSKLIPNHRAKPLPEILDELERYYESLLHDDDESADS